MANHTSMIDFIILEQMTAFAVIMQKHPGWVGKLLAVSYIHMYLEAEILHIELKVFLK